MEHLKNLFIDDREVYDAEREIRNVKIKSKVQGAFRSDLGSKIYCRVRG